MKKFLILFKRMCMKPLNLIILLILPVIAITFRMLPEKSVKSSITTGIYIEQDDQWLDSFKKLMGTHSDAFVFEFAGSSDELRNAVESGRYDCGYIIGKDFSANFIEDYKSARINVLTTSNTSYDTVTMEIIIAELLKAYDGAIIDHYLSVSSSASPYYTDDAEKLLDTAYSEILNSDEIFSISANDTGEFASIRLLDFTFPFEKFAGFVIFTASLMGLQTYKKDANDNIYKKLNKSGQLKFYVVNVLVYLLPAALSGFIAIGIFKGFDNTPALLLKMLLYILICMIFCSVLEIFVKSYRVFTAVLPIILACTLVLSPIFIDLTDKNVMFRLLSYLFPPTYM